MFAIVALPVAERVSVPGPKYSIMAFVPPLTERITRSFRITSFGVDQPFSSPVSFTPITFGTGSSDMQSPASAPPIPIAMPPSPQPFGVWESHPTMRQPGYA